MTLFRSASQAASRACATIVAASLPAAVALHATQAIAASDEARQQAAWREAIAEAPLPQAGCFTADYPSPNWRQVACTAAPKRAYIPRHGHHKYTVGNGNDYAAVVSGVITSTTGTFTNITGLKSETDDGQANSYSLQINSQFFKSPTCSGATNPASCLGWEQFVYSTEGYAFMQYWLINYGSHCPSGGWMSFSGDCYRNSNAVNVPPQVITQLGNLIVKGTASSSTDKLTMTTAAHAYSVTGNDDVVGLAKFWNASEFNVIGDGGGSQADFNSGTSLTVNIALKDGSKTAPTCKGDDGTTGETNNLNLGKCTATGGKMPSVSFIESN